MKDKKSDSVSVIGTPPLYYVAAILERVTDLRNSETRSMISMSGRHVSQPGSLKGLNDGVTCTGI